MNSSPFFIYRIEENQIQKLIDIAVATFDETFASTNSKENMEDYFSRCFNEEVFRSELKNPDSWFWFIDYHGKLAGYLKYNIGSAQTELHEENGFELERIYVLKEFYGKGVGATLMDFARENAKKLGKEYLWLGVHEENFRALKFYEKYNMLQFSDHVFMMGKQPQRDILLKMSL